ncbi:MAG: rubredoxin [Oscillospiraceae bacterium]
MKKYVCTICGFIYDEAAGIPSAGIPAGTKWESLPDNWVCPLCGAQKSEFKEKTDAPAPVKAPVQAVEEDLREVSFAELSAICSNLARGCEKQYLAKESELFTTLANYYKGKSAVPSGQDFSKLSKLVQANLEERYPAANATAQAIHDRGALRALVWSEKVTRMLSSLLNRYENEQFAFAQNTNVYVCEICGFIFIGDVPPEICPVCKVPRMKFAQIQRGE